MGHFRLVMHDCTLRRGTKTLLQSCTLTLPLAGVTLLKGANGAGKSTVLRALLGLEKPAKGLLCIQSGSAPWPREIIGYMPQGRREVPGQSEAALFLPATAHIRAALGKVAWSDIFRLRTQRLDFLQLLERVGIPLEKNSYVHRSLGQLSGGERQRVSLAQALAPLQGAAGGVLLLDEPLAGLDRAAQRGFVTLLDSLARQDVAILLTSHETDVLEPLVARSLMLMDGRLDVCV